MDESDPALPSFRGDANRATRGRNLGALRPGSGRLGGLGAARDDKAEPDRDLAVPDRANRFESGLDDAEAGSGGESSAQRLLPPSGTGTLGPVWDELADRAAHYATRARGAGTRRTYKSAWTHFSQSCRDL